MEGTAHQLQIWHDLADGVPHCLFEVKNSNYLLHFWLVQQEGNHCLQEGSVVALLPPRHNNEDKGYLLHVVVVSHKGIDGEKLREGLTAEFKGPIDMPGF